MLAGVVPVCGFLSAGVYWATRFVLPVTVAEFAGRAVGLWPFWLVLPAVAGETAWSRRRRVRFATVLSPVFAALAYLL